MCVTVLHPLISLNEPRLHSIFKTFRTTDAVDTDWNVENRYQNRLQLRCGAKIRMQWRKLNGCEGEKGPTEREILTGSEEDA